MTDIFKLKHGLTRRQFVKAAAFTGAAATAVGANIIVPGRARAAKKLTILQWQHFVPAYDKWFNEQWVKEWGAKNDTEVTVDNVGVTLLPSRMAAEASARKGHDLVMSIQPAPVYEELVIDHKDIYAECEKKWGKPLDVGFKSTYNPKTKRYHGFSDMFVPDPINYRKDLWDDVGINPDSWDKILDGGRKIKKKHNIPVGIGLSNEVDTAMAIRSLMYSNGAAEQDAEGNLTLKSKETLDCLKYMKSLFQDTMTPEVLAWDPSNNNRAMNAGTLSLALNAISITRTAENQKLMIDVKNKAGQMEKKPIHELIYLNKAAKGSVRQIGLEHVMSVYTIWQFAENKDGAQKFLVDLVSNYEKAFLASEFYNFPCFPKTVPKLQEHLKKDSKAIPADKYMALADVTNWATNIGYPGYCNAAIGEAWDTWVLNTMFAQAATGAETPERALDLAAAQYQRIFNKWKEKKMV